MKSIGLSSRIPVTAEDIFKFREEYIKNRNLTAWSFVNHYNSIEIVDIVITDDLDNLHTVNKNIGEMTIKVISVPDLIAMKQKSARPQDIEDIKALEALQ